jgi:hypothetical protein
MLPQTLRWTGVLDGFATNMSLVLISIYGLQEFGGAIQNLHAGRGPVPDDC